MVGPNQQPAQATERRQIPFLGLANHDWAIAFYQIHLVRAQLFFISQLNIQLMPN